MKYIELYLQPSDYSTMRLGQLSRKVNVKPSEIITYLKNEFDIEIGSHLNSKVDDSLTEKVISKFGSDTDTEVLITDKQASSNPIEQTTETEVDESSKPEKAITEDKPVVEYTAEQEIDTETIAKAPLIKAPKVALTGPTVVGRIDLPPPLSEQMVEIDGVMISKQTIADQKKEQREERKKKSRSRNEKRTSGTVRTSRRKSEDQIAQIKHDHEQKSLAKKIAHREERISKKHKEEKKSKSVYVAKTTKRKTKTVQALHAVSPKESTPENLSTFGKIWRWFNS